MCECVCVCVVRCAARTRRGTFRTLWERARCSSDEDASGIARLVVGPSAGAAAAAGRSVDVARTACGRRSTVEWSVSVASQDGVVAREPRRISFANTAGCCRCFASSSSSPPPRPRSQQPVAGGQVPRRPASIHLAPDSASQEPPLTPSILVAVSTLPLLRLRNAFIHVLLHAGASRRAFLLVGRVSQLAICTWPGCIV